MKQVYIDMDSVLVDFLSAIELRYGTTIPDCCGYDAIKWDEIKHALDTDFFHTAPAMPWTKDILMYLGAQVGPSNLFVITSADTLCRGHVEGKALWLHTHAPELVGNLIVTNHKHLCAAYERLLIDDLPSNVRSWENHGGKALHVPARWQYPQATVESFDLVGMVHNILNPDRPLYRDRPGPAPVDDGYRLVTADDPCLTASGKRAHAMYDTKFTKCGCMIAWGKTHEYLDNGSLLPKCRRCYAQESK